MKIRFRFTTLGSSLLLAAAVCFFGSSADAQDVRFKTPELQDRPVASTPSARNHYSNRNIRQVVHEEPLALAQLPAMGPTVPPPAPGPQLPVTTPQPMGAAQMDTVFPEMRPTPQQPVTPTAPQPTPQRPATQPNFPEVNTATPSAPAPTSSGLTTDSTGGSGSAVRSGSRSTSSSTTAIQDVPAATPLSDAFKLPVTQGKGAIEKPCPADIGIRSIKEINIDIRPVLTEDKKLPRECPLVHQDYQNRHFSLTCYRWKAAALCTKGAYFQDVHTERYGHSVCPAIQPVISGARFFADVVVLPYKMGLETPNECVYTLGYYRVGNCAPHMLDPIPLSLRGAVYQTGAVVGAAYLIP